MSDRLKVAVGSDTPVKINAVEHAFMERYPECETMVIGKKVPSGVSDQPMTNAETLLGARNRAKRLLEVYRDIDIAAGLEGGVEIIIPGKEKDPDTYIVTGFAYLLSRDGVEGLGISPGVIIPHEVMKLILDKGMEMSEAVSSVYGTNTKEDRDCTGVITEGYLSATDYYAIATNIAIANYDYNKSYRIHNAPVVGSLD